MSTLIPKLGEEILADAKAEAKKRIEEAKKEAKEKIEKAKVEAEKEAETVKSEILERIGIMERGRLSEVRRENSLKILEEKHRLMDKAYQEALKQLKKIVEDKIYITSLCHLIEISAPQLGEENIKIKLNSRDLKRKNEILKNLNLPSNLKLIVDEKPINTIGGCIILTQDEKIKIDETFETRLTATEKSIRKEVANILFTD